MADAPNTHGYRMQNGRHRGELITRVPVGYLRWMVRDRHSEARMAQAELDRRGTVVPDVEISGHAVDSASMRCRKIWLETRTAGEGLHAWLCRMSLAAIQHGEMRGEKLLYEGMAFVIEREGEWPLLKTIMRKGNKHRASAHQEVDDGGRD